MSPLHPGAREIWFVSVPCFYAAIERARNPALRARPVIVGGDPRKRGLVQSASPDAHEQGVEIGMSMLSALERCPRAKPVRTDMKHYREVSQRLQAVLRGAAAALEPAGLDAAFLSVRAPSDDAAAHELTDAVRDALDLPLRIGISAAKFLARVAAEQLPADGVLRVAAGEERSFLRPLPVTVLPGVGPKTVASLHALGLREVGQLETAERSALEVELGNHGLKLLELARGEDAAGVRPARLPRTLSHEHTFEAPQLDRALIGEQVQALADALERSLRQQDLHAGRVAVKLRYADGETVTRRETLGKPLRAAAQIAACATALLERTHAGTREIRGLGLSVASLTELAPDDRQLDLF